MWAQHPDIARRWAAECPDESKLPMHVKAARAKKMKAKKGTK